MIKAKNKFKCPRKHFYVLHTQCHDCDYFYSHYGESRCIMKEIKNFVEYKVGDTYEE